METVAGSPLENVLSLWAPSEEGQMDNLRAPDPGSALDAELVEGCRTGESSSYKRLYEIHGGRMKRLAVNMLGGTQDAEDAIQEAFLKIYRNMDGFKGDSRD